ncbi:hypothetical protein QL285_059634 [Trifolium repens]|nr:hypothetical protein QL285_059634 [Trifolium repens]
MFSKYKATPHVTRVLNHFDPKTLPKTLRKYFHKPQNIFHRIFQNKTIQRISLSPKGSKTTFLFKTLQHSLMLLINTLNFQNPNFSHEIFTNSWKTKITKPIHASIDLMNNIHESKTSKNNISHQTLLRT